MFTHIAFCIIGAVAYADGTDCSSVIVLPACNREYIADCYWHAPSVGDELGRSFIDVSGVTYEWDGIIG